MNLTVSPSRTYVAFCIRHDGGHMFKKFRLPLKSTNSSHEAEWFFMNRLDFEHVLIGCITHEDYLCLYEQENPYLEHEKILESFIEKLSDLGGEFVCGYDDEHRVYVIKWQYIGSLNGEEAAYRYEYKISYEEIVRANTLDYIPEKIKESFLKMKEADNGK